MAQSCKPGLISAPYGTAKVSLLGTQGATRNKPQLTPGNGGSRPAHKSDQSLGHEHPGVMLMV